MLTWIANISWKCNSGSHFKCFVTENETSRQFYFGYHDSWHRNINENSPAKIDAFSSPLKVRLHKSIFSSLATPLWVWRPKKGQKMMVGVFLEKNNDMLLPFCPHTLHLMPPRDIFKKITVGRPTKVAKHRIVNSK